MTDPTPALPESFFGIRERLYVALAAFFVASWLIGDLTGGKYFVVFGYSLSVGMIPFPLTFVLTDIIHEFYGPRGARQVTFIAAGMAAYVFLLLQLLIALPTSPESVVPDAVFSGAFGQSVRLFAASITAFLVGQLVDVKIFHAIRARTGAKHVWLRANGSTAVSQLVDTVIINTAFLAGQRPVGFIVQIIVASYVTKLVAAALLTPLLYVVHGIVARRLREDDGGSVVAPAVPLRAIAKGTGIVVAVLVAYLALYPTGMDPVAYRPAARADFSGAFEPLPAPLEVEVLHPSWVGAESLVLDEDGRLFAGLADGRIMMRGRRGKERDLVDTGGRPLGMISLGGRRLAVADADRGLLEVDTERRHVRVLVDRFEGRRMRFVDDVTSLPDGNLLFTDASDRFGIEDYRKDIIEHRPRGRVFHFDRTARRTTLVADGLYFANGIAASVDGSYAIVCETGANRLTRVELSGPSRGRKSTFRDALPGFCDNIRREPTRDVFWVALVAPRNDLLDSLAGRPFLRQVITRLPTAMQPAPEVETDFFAISGAGQVLVTHRNAAPGAFGPVTTVLAHDGRLYLGSLTGRGLGVIAAMPPMRGE